MLLLVPVACAFGAPVVIGSKKFTESYVLGEIAKRTLIDAGIPAEHRQGMGGTIILWQALRGGQIDGYPEYTGTITQEILKRDDASSLEQIRESLAKFGVGMTEPLGFNNTYALVMRRSEAQRLGVRTISDLQKYPELKIGLTHEFLDRQDGWQPLRERYALPQQNVVGIDHALGYAALANSSIDVKDAYSTDAKIEQNDLVVLEDDLQFFPKYDAVFLFRSSMRPDAIAALRRLEGTLDEKRMIRLNAEAERTKNYAKAADLYFNVGALRSSGQLGPSHIGESFPHKLVRWTLRHLQLAGFSLLLSVVVGIPLGIVASRGGPIGQGILGFRQHCANDSIASVAGVACPPSLFRNQRPHGDRCAFPLWVAADRAQHRERLAGHPAIIARIRHCIGTQPDRRGSGKFISRWRRARFCPESKRAP